MTCGGIVVVVAAAAVAAVDAEIMIDQNFGVPFLLTQDFSSFVVPASLDQDFSMTATAAVAVAAVHADHLSLGVPTLQVQHHLSLLELVEIAVAAAAAGCCEEQRTVALAADHVGNSGIQVAGTAVDLILAGYQKGSRIADPDLDRMNQGSPCSKLQMKMKEY